MKELIYELSKQKCIFHFIKKNLVLISKADLTIQVHLMNALAIKLAKKIFARIFSQNAWNSNVKMIFRNLSLLAKKKIWQNVRIVNIFKKCQRVDVFGQKVQHLTSINQWKMKMKMKNASPQLSDNRSIPQVREWSQIDPNSI